MSAAGAGLEVRNLHRDEVPQAVALLARGMRDNPVHVAAFGTDPESRRRRLERLFGALFRIMTRQTPICALREGTMVGTTGIAPPGTCQPTTPQRLRFLLASVGLGPGSAARAGRWFAAWSARDLDEPHSHLGPLAVDAHLQGQGIGTRILIEYGRRLDAEGLVGYLETDKAENVRLYERHGFEVIGEQKVIGIPNWFMRRPPRAG